MREATIAGAGIGGLTTALALEQAGCRVRVVDKVSALEPIGAAIVLAPNAVRSLRSLGVGDALDRIAHIAAMGGLRAKNGAWIHQFASTFASDDTPTLVLRRSDLVDLLVSRLAPQSLQLGETVQRVTTAGDVVTDKNEWRSELVVGADGLRSSVRQAIAPRHPGLQFAGFMAWRAIVPVPSPEAFETWGDGRIFGVVPLDESPTYIYATAREKAGSANHTAEGLRAAFEGWLDPIPQLLSLVNDDILLAHDVMWLRKRLAAYHSGSVALVGDAAHAMTPNLGQGACLAIEDAVTIGALLANDAPVDAALARFSQVRVGRTQRIASQSAAMGVIAHLKQPLVAAARNLAIALGGKFASSRGVSGIVDWRPPAPRPR